MNHLNYYSADYALSNEMAGTMAIVLLVMYLVMFALAIVMYIFNGIGLYTIGKKRGVKCYGLAWVPGLEGWVIGSVADHYNLNVMGKKSRYRHFLLWYYIAYFIAIFAFIIWFAFKIVSMTNNAVTDAQIFGVLMSFMGVWLLMSAVAIVYYVFYFIALNKVYKSCNPNTSTVFTVLSIIFTVTIPFFIFANRNKMLGLQTKEPQPPENNLHIEGQE